MSKDLRFELPNFGSASFNEVETGVLEATYDELRQRYPRFATELFTAVCQAKIDGELPEWDNMTEEQAGATMDAARAMCHMAATLGADVDSAVDEGLEVWAWAKSMSGVYKLDNGEVT